MFVSLDRTLPVVVLVAGHAGTGKTRFSKQLMARAVALRRPMVFLDKDTLGASPSVPVLFFRMFHYLAKHMTRRLTCLCGQTYQPIHPVKVYLPKS